MKLGRYSPIRFLCTTNIATLCLAAWLLSGSPEPQAFGQAAASAPGYCMTSQQTSDQGPVCFVLKTDDPAHLLVYKADSAGQLQLCSSREIRCDLLLKDHHFPRGQVTGYLRTMPPVTSVCKSVQEK